MSSEVNPLRLVLPLKHMALVKTAQLLWRNSEGKEWLKEHYQDLGSEPTESMLEHLKIPDDKLPVPVGLKPDIKISLKCMVWRAVHWLFFLKDWRQGREKGGEIDEKFVERIIYFIDNFSWTNEGCVDGETMLKSYVNNKETTDFGTWANLCEYCIEDKIIKFGKAMDWKNCEGRIWWDDYRIYWYWRVYGKLPTKKMFGDPEISRASYRRFRRILEKQFSDEISTNRNYLNWAITSASCSAVKYFHNRVKSIEEFLEEASGSDSVQVYIHREITKETLLKCIKNQSHFFSWYIYWPWALFIEDWIQLLEEVHFTSLFDTCFYTAGTGDVGIKWSYKVWEKIWRVFYQKFGSDENSLRGTLTGIKKNEGDHLLWEIIREGMDDSQRISIAKSATNIAEKLLKNDEERNMIIGKT